MSWLIAGLVVIWALARALAESVPWMMIDAGRSRKRLIADIQSSLRGVNANGWQEALALCREKADWPLAVHCQLMIIAAPHKLEAMYQKAVQAIRETQLQAVRTQLAITLVTAIVLPSALAYGWWYRPAEWQEAKLAVLTVFVLLLASLAHGFTYWMVKTVHGWAMELDLKTLDQVRDLLSRHE